MNDHNDTKKCPKCEQVLPLENFNKQKERKDGLQVYCKICKYSYNSPEVRERQKVAREKKKENKKQYDEDRRIKNSEKILKQQRERALVIKKEAVEKYGGKCACCGETELNFLAIDHKNGGGTKQRRENNLYGNKMYRFLLKQEISPEYRVLCHNCNWSSHLHGGTCIHKLKKQLEDDKKEEQFNETKE